MKMGHKVLAIALGVLMIVGGVWCMVTPGFTFLTIGWVLGASMVANALGSIVTWFSRRGEGAADGWTFASGVVSLVLGVVLLMSEGMQLAVDLFVAYLAAIWVLTVSALRISRALRLRRVHRELDTAVVGVRWWVPMISGVALAVVGVMGLVNPSLAMVAIGSMIGLSIVASGVNLIATACSA